jgi:type IV secretion system protein VirB6
MPQTASLFVLTTSGFSGAFRIAVGILLAVGPLAIMCLLFDSTLGIFSGWIRALAGTAFASLAAVTVTAIDLMVVEGELAHLQAMRSSGLPQIIDPQGLTTIVIVFAVVMLVTTVAAARVTSAFRLPSPTRTRHSPPDRVFDALSRPAVAAVHVGQQTISERLQTSGQDRAAGIAEALAATVRREQINLIESRPANGSARSRYERGTSIESAVGGVSGLGTIGRRSLGRRTRTAARRDRVQ